MDLSAALGGCWSCSSADLLRTQCNKPKACPWCYLEKGHCYSREKGPYSTGGEVKKARWCTSLIQRDGPNFLSLGCWCPLATADGRTRTWKRSGSSWKTTCKAVKHVALSGSKARGSVSHVEQTRSGRATTGKDSFRSPSCCGKCLLSGGVEHGTNCTCSSE